jgi:hypothetical protein
MDDCDCLTAYPYYHLAVCARHLIREGLCSLSGASYLLFLASKDNRILERLRNQNFVNGMDNAIAGHHISFNNRSTVDFNLFT